jgi:hypothetical protein
MTPLPFDDIIERVANEMEVLCAHTQDCGDRAGYKRALYCVGVSAELFDVFFNSEFGYRGEYFHSPERGLASNRLILREVAPRLVAHAQGHETIPGSEFATRSLLMASAKVWLAEEALALCERCEGEWRSSLSSPVQIHNGRWELDTHLHAQWGRQAHAFRKLRFIGAFVDDADDEYVAAHKKHRASDICARGWA